MVEVHPPPLEALRALRGGLAAGRLTPADQRTPDENVGNAIFRTLDELLHVVDEYRRRGRTGERCRLVEHEHVRKDGHMVVEFVIEVMP